jgi:hypothetical protein
MTKSSKREACEAEDTSPASLVGEIAWLAREAQTEIETLAAGGNPVIHWMLLQNVAQGIVTRSTQLRASVQETIDEIAALSHCPVSDVA